MGNCNKGLNSKEEYDFKTPNLISKKLDSLWRKFYDQGRGYILKKDAKDLTKLILIDLSEWERRFGKNSQVFSGCRVGKTAAEEEWPRL